MEIAENYDIKNIENMTPYQAKRVINSIVTRRNLLKMLDAANTKSKIHHLTSNRNKINITKPPEYLNILPRTEASWIFKARTRMIDVKNNFRGKYANLTCRGCSQNKETQNHVLAECQGIHKDNTTKIEIEEIFDDTNDASQLKITATKIKNVIQELNKSDAPSPEGAGAAC